MGMLRRVRNVVAASVNSLLDGLEGPEAMLGESIRRMEGSLAGLRKETASAIASVRLAERRLERERTAAETWAERAEKAVREGSDGLAQDAVRQRRAAAERAGRIEEQLPELRQLSDRMKGALKDLTNRLARARGRRDILVARARSAEIRSRFSRNLAAVRTVRLPGASDAGVDFGSAGEAIERKTAEAEAADELSGGDVAAAFERMRRDEAVDKELAEISGKVRG